MSIDERTRIDAIVDLWVEVSDDGTTWRRSERVDTAQETGRDCRELRAILATYVAVMEATGSRLTPVRNWFRVVMQGAESGTVLAVVPRHWNAAERRYEITGGEWMITDYSTAYQAWCLNLVRTRLTAA
jgi:hypothetical protein